MNNLGDVCLVGLGVKENYVSGLVIVVIYMEFGGATRCRGGFNPKTAGEVNFTPPVVFRNIYVLKRG